MITDSELEQRLRAADPASAVAIPEVTSLPRTQGRRPAWRRRYAGAAIAAALAAALGASLAISGYRQGEPGTSQAVNCIRDNEADALVAFDARTDDPTEVCRRRWRQLFGLAAPADLIACVDDSAQRSINVRVATCNAEGETAFAAVTPDQRSLADARAQIERWLTSRQCANYDDLSNYIASTLQAVGLHDWTVRRHTSSASRGCFEVVAYNESTRTVVVSAGAP